MKTWWGSLRRSRLFPFSFFSVRSFLSWPHRNCVQSWHVDVASLTRTFLYSHNLVSHQRLGQPTLHAWRWMLCKLFGRREYGISKIEMAIWRRRRLEVVCKVADRKVVIIMTRKKIQWRVLLRIGSPWGGKIKTRARLLLVPQKWGKADKADKGRSKVFALLTLV